MSLEEMTGRFDRRTVLKMAGMGVAATGLSGVAGATSHDGAQAAPRRIVLRSKDAANMANRAFPTTDEAYTKQGSWYTTGDTSDGSAGSDKLGFYLSPEMLGVDSMTLADLHSMSYHTKKVGAPVDGNNAPNIYVNVYTEEDGTDDGSWYGYRLTFEPYLSNNLDAPADEWVEWSTDAGTNQLTFFDAPTIGSYGFYGQPTLADLQSGPINWNDYTGSGPVTSIDYASEEVKYIVFDTGSGWADDYEGYLDTIGLVVDGGRGNSGKPTAYRIELEK